MHWARGGPYAKNLQVFPINKIFLPLALNKNSHYTSFGVYKEILSLCQFIANQTQLQHHYLIIKSQIAGENGCTGFKTKMLIYTVSMFINLEELCYKMSVSIQCPRNMPVFQTCLTLVWRLPCSFTMDYIASSDKWLTFPYSISHTLQLQPKHTWRCSRSACQFSEPLDKP